MLPTETGTERAPDRLSIWPLDGGLFGIDASYQGPAGLARADAHQQHLINAGHRPELTPNLDAGWTLRLNPLGADEAWSAIELLIGPRDAGLEAALRRDLGGGYTILMGALTAGAAWTAVEAFIGPRPD
jgi:hypothetical protein